MRLRTVVGRNEQRPSALRQIATKALSLSLCTIVALVSCIPAVAAEPTDWFQWRGPEGTGISRETGLPTSWNPKNGDGVLWEKEEYGTRCTPIVMNGKMYVVTRYKAETTEEGERLACIDAKTGELLWERHQNVFLSDAPAERVGWSSVIGDPSTGNVFWLGLGCEFHCLNGETGESLWTHALSEEYGMLSTYGGRTNFPIVFEDLVIVSGVMTQWGANAVPAHRFVAFDKRTGASVWFSSTTPKPKDTTYSTPFLTSFDGQAAIVFGAGDGKIHAMQPRTGKIIWSYHASTRGIFTSPSVVDNIVYCGFHEQNVSDTRILGAIFAFDGRATGEIGEDDLLWKNEGEEIKGGQPVVLDGRVYVVDRAGKLFVFDAKSGEEIFSQKVGRGPGAVTYGDGKLYVTESLAGMYWVFEITDDGLKQVEKIRVNRESFIAAPILAGGRVYITSLGKMRCIGEADVSPESAEVPGVLTETPVGEDQEVAHIQVAPVEAMLAPGQSTPYQVRAYNKNGQFLKIIDNAKFEVEGGGSITDEGVYKAPEGDKHIAVFIKATAGEASSTARARILPPLPWKFEFEDKAVPITWIGANYRHLPFDFSGQNVLRKRSDIPLGTRSQSWMGWTTLSDYTIQADVYSTENPDNKERADMGVINQRYTLDLMNKGQLQIRSWTPRLENRFAKTIPFEWDSNTWYTIKFQSENKDGKAVLRGKVWKRGEDEPAEWAIEAADAVPNTSGSPGLFGKSTNSEFYIDNVMVYENE